MALGGIGGIKALNDLILNWIFTLPKLVGTVEDSFWLSDFEDARKGVDTGHLVLLARVRNIHSTPTSVIEWRIELEYYSGESEKIKADSSAVEFWKLLKDARHPRQQGMREDCVFTKFTHNTGWLRFPVSLHLSEEAKCADEIRCFSLVAVDGRGKAHRIHKGEPPQYG